MKSLVLSALGLALAVGICPVVAGAEAITHPSCPLDHRQQRQRMTSESHNRTH